MKLYAVIESMQRALAEHGDLETNLIIHRTKRKYETLKVLWCGPAPHRTGEKPEAFRFGGSLIRDE